MLHQPGELRRLLASKMGKGFRVVYVPMTGEVEEHFELVAAMAMAAQNIVLYVDEIDLLCSPAGYQAPNSLFWSKDENKFRPRMLKEILNRGRHKGIAMVSMSRFPTQVHPAIRSQAREMRVFRSDDPNYVGHFASKDGRFATMLPALGDFEYVLWQDGREPVIAGGRRNL